jgi:ornithine cyclodeaminase/alanine dehydrogenase-like protein (mu-crystallin family)
MVQAPIFVTAAQCQELLGPEDVVQQIEQALRWDAAGQIHWPTPRSLNIAPDRWGNDYHVKACVLEAIPVAGLRLVSHPLDEASPVCTRLIVLIDPATTLALAIVDESWSYAQRTVASIAMAARHLSLPSARTLGVVGAGRLARTAIDYYVALFELDEIRIASRRAETREALAAEMSEKHGIAVRAVETIRDAVEDADLVLTATSATTPLLEEPWVRAGAVVASVGTAEPGRQLASASDLLIVDSREQLRKELIAEFGDEAPDWVKATVGEIVSGAHPGRTDPSQRILLITEGIASQDIALAHLAYERAVRQGLSLPLPLAGVEAASTTNAIAG